VKNVHEIPPRESYNTKGLKRGSTQAYSSADQFPCGGKILRGRRRLGALRGRLLVVGEDDQKIHVEDLRDFPLSNDEARTAGLIVRLAFPRFPPSAAIAGTMLSQLRIVAPRRFPFCRPYYQQLADRPFGFTTSCWGEGTFAGLNPSQQCTSTNENRIFTGQSFISIYPSLSIFPFI
jgi:hypothetical protein